MRGLVACITVGASLTPGSCYIAPPAPRSEAPRHGGLHGPAAVRPEFQGPAQSTTEPSWFWNPLAFGAALGLLVAVLGGPMKADALAFPAATQVVNTLVSVQQQLEKTEAKLAQAKSNSEQTQKDLQETVQELAETKARVRELQELFSRQLSETSQTLGEVQVRMQELQALQDQLKSATTKDLKPAPAPAAAPAKKAGWSHTDIEAWSKDYPDCDANSQSPIDINTNKVDSKQATDSLEKRVKYSALNGLKLANNGHVMQVDGSFGTFNLPDGEYEVKQFHLHFPAEHKVNGKLNAGELHIVHQKKGSTGVKDLAVVGIILEQNESAGNTKEVKFLESLGFGQPMPQAGDKQQISGSVDLNDFYDEISSGFYHYEGSLTTPPCAEGVHWYVAKKPAPVTKEMIKNFKDRFPGESDNRPVQAVNGRKIVVNRVDVDGEFDN